MSCCPRDLVGIPRYPFLLRVYLNLY
jgi:hypothetical protein